MEFWSKESLDNGPRSPLSSRSAWHRQPVRRRRRPGQGRGAGRRCGRLRPAHRVGVVALTRTPVHPTHPQQEPRT